MSQENKPSDEAPGNPPAKRSNAFLDWLLVRQEIATLGDASLTPARSEFLRRARVAFEVAEQARRNRLESGSTAAVSLDLLRQAVYWALRANGSLAEPPTVAAVLAESDHVLKTSLKAKNSELADLSSVLHSDFIELADRSAEQNRRVLKALSRASKRLIAVAARPERRLEWAKLKRAARVLCLVLPVVLPLVVAVWWKNHDLARGVPWHTSSVWAKCRPDKSECGGHPTNILFHTKHEENPWFEYDFGKPLEFSSVTIRNRSDGGSELAVPLVVEASDDGQHFRELARRTEVFWTWHPRFAATRARYLRVRALKKTYLHLEAIKVHP
jgi:hypothetical protein